MKPSGAVDPIAIEQRHCRHFQLDSAFDELLGCEAPSRKLKALAACSST
jgi:hypothetical protein